MGLLCVWNYSRDCHISAAYQDTTTDEKFQTEFSPLANIGIINKLGKALLLNIQLRYRSIFSQLFFFQPTITELNESEANNSNEIANKKSIRNVLRAYAISFICTPATQFVLFFNFGFTSEHTTQGMMMNRWTNCTKLHEWIPINDESVKLFDWKTKLCTPNHSRARHISRQMSSHTTRIRSALCAVCTAFLVCINVRT